MQDIKLRLHPDLQRLSKAEANSINCEFARKQLMNISPIHQEDPRYTELKRQQEAEEEEGSEQMEQHDEEEESEQMEQHEEEEKTEQMEQHQEKEGEEEEQQDVRECNEEETDAEERGKEEEEGHTPMAAAQPEARLQQSMQELRQQLFEQIRLESPVTLTYLQTAQSIAGAEQLATTFRAALNAGLPGAAWIRRQIRHRILLCTTNLGRDDALMLIAPINLLWLLLEHPLGCWNIVTFGRDCDIHLRLKEKWHAAVQLGILRVASGGEAGLDQYDIPWVDTSDSHRLYNGDRFCRHWHASVAKNTAHLFGMREELQRQSGSLLFGSSSSSGGCAPCKGNSSSSGGWAPCRASSSCSGWCVGKCQEEHERILSLMGRAPTFSTVLVNLDGDNIMGKGFLAVVAEHAATHCLQGWVLQVHTRQGGTTGRIACWASDWCYIRGYDQEQGILGSGAQDIDLRERLKQLSKQVNGTCVISAITNLEAAGIAVDNFPHSNRTRKQDRNIDKIIHCSPHELQAQEETWAKFNSFKYSLMQQKRMQRQSPIRNNLGEVDNEVGAFFVRTL